jgi:hypothetical protein
MFLSTRANGSDPPGLVLSKHAFQGTVKGFTAGIFFLSAQALSAIIMIVLPAWDFPAEKSPENLSLLQSELFNNTMILKDNVLSPQVLKNLCVTRRVFQAD